MMDTIDRANELRYSRGRGLFLKYKSGLLTGMGNCIYCHKSTMQTTVIDTETDEKVGICSLCLKPNK